MSEFIVGLTGGIGSGKTAVSDKFAALGVDVIDTDILARDVVARGESALAQIAQRFGQEVLQADGQLDRRALREIVFQDPAQKQWLDNLLHPLIRERMVSQAKQARSAYCILVIPLLVENGLQTLVDRVAVVDVDTTIQRTRAASRDGQSTEQVQRIMDAQASRQKRLELADDVIDNSGALNQLDAQITTLHQRYIDIVKKQAKA